MISLFACCMMPMPGEDTIEVVEGVPITAVDDDGVVVAGTPVRI